MTTQYGILPAPMAALDSDAAKELSGVSHILCDLDDTLTTDGVLLASSYAALERLKTSGRHVVVVTGRPAGWCDMIARLWPVSAVVGENGAFAFRYERQAKRMHRRFQRAEDQRHADQARLARIFARVREKHPEVRLSADQAYRVSDYAVDFCEDAPRLEKSVIDDIVAIFAQGGATAKISSIHINAWIGDFDKLGMCLTVLTDDLGVEEQELSRSVLYVGDSPNDEPMFHRFPLSVGVANIRPFLSEMRAHPRWISDRAGGRGFTSVVDMLLGEPFA